MNPAPLVFVAARSLLGRRGGRKAAKDGKGAAKRLRNQELDSGILNLGTLGLDSFELGKVIIDGE